MTNILKVKCHFLVKIGKKEYMEKLIENGEVYMNTTRYFREHKNPEIGDEFEGALYIKDGKVSEYRENLDNEKLFCMWHINDTTPVSEELIYSYHVGETDQVRVAFDLRKLSGFTDNEDSYMVVIYNVKEFNKRFSKACEELNVKFVGSRIVSYFDELKVKPDRMITPYMKREKYKKQQEVRYLILKDNNGPLTLSLGSLKDIACIHDVNRMCLSVI